MGRSAETFIVICIFWFPNSLKSVCLKEKKKKKKNLQIVEWDFTRSEFVNGKIQIPLCTPSRNLSRYLIQREGQQATIQLSRNIQLCKTAILESDDESRGSSPRRIDSHPVLRWDGVFGDIMSPHVPDFKACRIVIHGRLVRRRGGYVKLVGGGGGNGE